MRSRSSRQRRLLAERAERQGYTLERTERRNHLDHPIYALRRGRNLPSFVGSIGEVERWLAEPKP